jgi:hypothetical protein
MKNKSGCGPLPKEVVISEKEGREIFMPSAKPNIINVVSVGSDWAISATNSTIKNPPPKGKQMGGES